MLNHSPQCSNDPSPTTSDNEEEEEEEADKVEEERTSREDRGPLVHMQ